MPAHERADSPERRNEAKAGTGTVRVDPWGRLSEASTLGLAIEPTQEPTVAATRKEPSERYRILSTLHRGGMGEILLAQVEGLDGFARKLVLKGLLSRVSSDHPGYQLFMCEARLMAQLDHPNIIRVFDLVMIDGWPYLAMEYLRGRNFYQLIQRSIACCEDMPLRIALHVVAEALRGLHFAHTLRDESGRALGIVHRDVTPGNILVSFFGEVKVTDFGIAKSFDAPKNTAPKSIRGKARYVAPEQVYGEPASVQSDVYSAGVVLAEAIMGAPLWERSSIPETLLAIVSEERTRTIARVLEGQREVPGLAVALRGALALSKDDRFVSALQFAETLEGIERTLGGPCTRVELCQFLRSVFKDAPDMPPGETIGHSARAPQGPAETHGFDGSHEFGASHGSEGSHGSPESAYDDADPTLIEIAADLFAKSNGQGVTRDVPNTRSVPSPPSAAPAEEQPSGLPIRVPSGLATHAEKGDRGEHHPPLFGRDTGQVPWLLTGVLIGATLATIGCLFALMFR